MTRIIIPRLPENFERKSFRVGSTAISMGKLVKLNTSTGRLDVCGTTSAGANAIGVIDYDHNYVAKNSGTTSVTAGDPINVALFGRSVNLVSGGTFLAGVFVQQGTSGAVIAEATATTRSVDTIGIALEASTASGQTVEILTIR